MIQKQTETLNNEANKETLSNLISYFTTHNMASLMYAEALDDLTVAHLNIMVVIGMMGTDTPVPSKRIS